MAVIDIEEWHPVCISAQQTAENAGQG